MTDRPQQLAAVVRAGVRWAAGAERPTIGSTAERSSVTAATGGDAGAGVLLAASSGSAILAVASLRLASLRLANL